MIAVVLTALVGTGCQSFERRFTAIESRQTALEAQLADLQAQQQTLIARQVQLRQELDNALQPLRTQSADRGEDLRSMRREVVALEERIADLDGMIARVSEQVAAGGGTTDRGPAATGMPPPRDGRAADTEPAGPADNEAATLYSNAYGDYLGNNYELCIQGFEEYLRRYGTSERADDAMYWTGECHAARGDNPAARDAFRQLIRDYPASELIPDAMFRDAFILEQEGRDEAAAEGFRRLIQAYSTSDAAYLACRQLDAMGVDRPAACEQLQ